MNYPDFRCLTRLGVEQRTARIPAAIVADYDLKSFDLARPAQMVQPAVEECGDPRFLVVCRRRSIETRSPA
jgi:hypothetical protein